ncbi:MAG: hypothetical protein AB2A00_40470 [Myxococcota bacterium]
MRPVDVTWLMGIPGTVWDATPGQAMGWVSGNLTTGLSAAEYFMHARFRRQEALTTRDRRQRAQPILRDTMTALGDMRITRVDCGTRRGFRVGREELLAHVGRILVRDARSPSGAVLQRAGAPLHRDMVTQLGDEGIWLRSAAFCDEAAGICATCHGVDASGRLPRVGDNVGFTLVRALGEALPDLVPRWFHIC